MIAEDCFLVCCTIQGMGKASLKKIHIYLLDFFKIAAKIKNGFLKAVFAILDMRYICSVD